MGFSFHLCQPGAGASCGACCGLYNFRDHSREALAKTLSRRSEVIRRTPKEPAAFRDAARSLRRWDKDRLFDAVRICPLLGFLDEAETRVGCLAHPAANDGIDLRDCGAYDASTCGSFECPSFLWLVEPQAKLVRAACPDWYLYGLVITDVELVRGVIQLLERSAGGPVDPERVADNPEALAAVAELFALKERFSREREGGVFGRFERDELGEPGRRIFDYEALGVSAAQEDEVVLCLGYEPSDGAGLEEVRGVVRGRIEAAVRALEGAA